MIYVINKLFFIVSVPQCSNQITTESTDDLYCNINELFSCGENQVCVQLEALHPNLGQCQCKQGFDKQADGVRNYYYYFVSNMNFWKIHNKIS